MHIDTKLVQDYALERNALIVNQHPIVEVFRIWDYRYHTPGFVIEDITIDGNLEENPTPVGDPSLEAIHLASTGEATVQRCHVRNWIADGIGDQWGRHNVIRDCVVEGCRGNGFHPGTSAGQGAFRPDDHRRLLQPGPAAPLP